MINLAGNKDADKHIKEELYLAGIPTEYVGLTNSEVPYTIIGKLGKWKLTRAWYYWVARVENDGDGLPLGSALELHNWPNPIEPEFKMGSEIRCGGHGGALSPDEYGAQPVYNEELNNQLKAIGEYKEVNFGGKMAGPCITVGRISELCNEGKLTVERYVNSYHIDTLIGLRVFADYINKTE